MELVKSKDSKYEEYENLLLERDQLEKEGGQAWTVYIQTFGQQITDIYEEKLECIKAKKTIAYYQKAANRGGVVDQEDMKKYLEQEMASYYANLKRMLDDNERCRNARTSTAYEVERSKMLYRRLAKLIHPDINPQTDCDEGLRELWTRVCTAYAHNDVKSLAELEVLIRKALKDLGDGAVTVEIPDLEEKIEELKEEIERIKRTEPYTYRALLEDEEAVAKKTSELNEELESYRKYRKDLDEVIQNILNSGRIKIKWVLN